MRLSIYLFDRECPGSHMSALHKTWWPSPVLAAPNDFVYGQDERVHALVSAPEALFGALRASASLAKPSVTWTMSFSKLSLISTLVRSTILRSCCMSIWVL